LLPKNGKLTKLKALASYPPAAQSTDRKVALGAAALNVFKQ
jgi:hypothetical protein